MPLRILLCTFLSGTIAVHAQAPKDSPTSARTASPRFLTGAFDPNASVLPPNFVGHDAEAIFTAVQAHKKSIEKSEFETRADYDARAAAFGRTTLVNGMTPSSTFAFVLPLEAVYDADAAEMTISSPLKDELVGEQFEKAWSAVVKERWIPNGSYIGTNAFGVRKKISKSILIRTSVTITQMPFWLGKDVFPNVEEGDPESLKLAMTPQEGKLHKAGLRVVLVGRLNAPFTLKSQSQLEPTIDSPYDITEIDEALVLALQELWIADVKTGVILARYSEKLHESKFPIHVTITRKNHSLTPSISADGEKKEFPILADGVHIDAQHEVKLTTGKEADAVLPYNIMVNGTDKTADWSCSNSHGSSYKICTMVITRQNAGP